MPARAAIAAPAHQAAECYVPPDGICVSTQPRRKADLRTRRTFVLRRPSDGRQRPAPDDVNAGRDQGDGDPLHRGGPFAKHGDEGSHRAAAVASLIAIAKLNGLDPETYLRDVLDRIADLLPWNLKPRTTAHAA